MHRLALSSLVAAALACGSQRAPVAPASAPPAPVVVADVPPPSDVAAPAPDVAPDAAPDAAAPDAAAPDPRALRLRALADGSVPLAQAIDPARGVTIIRHVEAPPSGRGRARISDQRLCGAALTRALPAIRRDLAAAVEQAGEDAIACGADGTCIVPGMEYQSAWQIYFVDVQGTLRLDAVAELSIAAMNGEWVDAVNGHVTRALAAARQRPCPQRP